MLYTVGRLRTVFDRAKVVFEYLCKGVLFFLNTDDVRVLVSLRVLMIRKPLRNIGVAA